MVAPVEEAGRPEVLAPEEDAGLTDMVAPKENDGRTAVGDRNAGVGWPSEVVR